MRLLTLLPIAAAIGLAELGSYWWMHPAKDPNAPPPQVLTFDWDALEAECTGPHGKLVEDPTDNSNSSSSSLRTSHFALGTPSPPHLTYLPDDAEEAIKKLRCTTGRVAKLEFAEGGTCFLAWFEWNDESRGDVAEAFKHAPEVCMGALGLELRGMEEPRPLSVAGTTLTFDHTRFSSGGAHEVHVFKASWLEGLPDDTAASFRDPRTRRIHVAAERARLAKARTVMATFHGIPSAESAWSFFGNRILAYRTLVRTTEK